MRMLNANGARGSEEEERDRWTPLRVRSRSTRQGAILPPVSHGSPFLPRPNPYSATLGLPVMARKCFIRLTSVNYRHQYSDYSPTPPTTCNTRQNVTVEVGLVRRQREGCRLLERKLSSHRRRVRRGVIHPSVRPRPSGPRTRPSLLRSFPVNSFSLSSSL